VKFTAWQIIDTETIQVPPQLRYKESDVTEFMRLVLAAGEIAKYPIVRSLGYDGRELIFELCNDPHVLEAVRRLSKAGHGSWQIACVIAENAAQVDAFLQQVG